MTNGQASCSVTPIRWLHFDPRATEQEVTQTARKVLLEKGDDDTVAELHIKVSFC